jgi:hypothetical protein
VSIDFHIAPLRLPHPAFIARCSQTRDGRVNHSYCISIKISEKMPFQSFYHGVEDPIHEQEHRQA